MTTYLMYQTDAKTSPARRLTDAAQHYRLKHGRAPNAARVHPTQLPACPVDGIAVVPDRHIHPAAVWVGVEDAAVADISPEVTP